VAIGFAILGMADANRLFDTIAEDCVRRAERLTGNTLAEVLFALAVTDAKRYQPAITTLWRRACTTVPQDEWTTESAVRLREVRATAVIELLSALGKPLLSTGIPRACVLTRQVGSRVFPADPESFDRRLRECGAETVRKNAHDAVAVMLKNVGWEFEEAFFVCGALCLDFADPLARVGIILVAAEDLLIAGDGLATDSGLLTWRLRVLRAAGWQVARLNFDEWEDASARGTEAVYLTSLLTGIGVNPSQDADIRAALAGFQCELHDGVDLDDLI